MSPFAMFCRWRISLGVDYRRESAAGQFSHVVLPERTRPRSVANAPHIYPGHRRSPPRTSHAADVRSLKVPAEALLVVFEQRACHIEPIHCALNQEGGDERDHFYPELEFGGRMHILPGDCVAVWPGKLTSLGGCSAARKPPAERRRAPRFSKPARNRLRAVGANRLPHRPPARGWRSA